MNLSVIHFPWQVRVGQAEDSSWVAEVTFSNLPAEALAGIVESAKRYQHVSSHELATCIISAEDPTRLFFVVGSPTGRSPIQILENPSFPDLSESECRRLAVNLTHAVRTLHGQALGLWVVDPRLLWEVDGNYLLVPVFWLPWAGLMAGTGRLAPEIATTTGLPTYDQCNDVFALAFTCYEALSGAPPLLPHPKLPGNWNPQLAAWDAALDAGLRMRPTRRSQTVDEWMALLLEAENFSSNPPTLQVSPALPLSSSEAIPAVNPPAKPRAHAFSAGKLWPFAALLALLLAWLFLRERGFGSSFQRGFADSIVRYADKSYDGAKWEKIYSADNLRPGRGHFRRICGWDDSNFAILGDGTVGGISGALLVLFRGGMKDLPETFDSGQGRELIDARFLDAERMALFYPSASGVTAKLALKGPAGLQELGDRGANYSTRLAILAPDIIFATGENIDPWRFSGGKFSQANEQSQDYYVRGEKNIVAVSESRSMDVKYVTSITTLSPGKALGLWSYEYHDAAAIVRYENGKWLLVQELKGFNQHSCPNRAWFVDERNLVAVGSPKVVRIKDGMITQHALTLDGKPFSGEELIAVWGSSPDNFCVSDKKGNVFGFKGGDLVPIVRGPELKGRDGGEDREARFVDIWVSPTATVFAVTKNDELYQLK